MLDELTYVGQLWLRRRWPRCWRRWRERPRHVTVVITGRNAPDELVAAADLVTEMKSIKHPFAAGKKAVPGVDY